MFITEQQLYKLLSDNGFISITKSDGTKEDTLNVYNGEKAFKVDDTLLAQATIMPDVFDTWVQQQLAKYGQTTPPAELYYNFQLDNRYGKLDPELAEFYRETPSKVMQALAFGYVVDSDVNPTYYYIKISKNYRYLPPVYSIAVSGTRFYYLVLDVNQNQAFFQRDKGTSVNELIRFTMKEIKQWFPDFVPFAVEATQDDIDFPAESLTTTTTTNTTTIFDETTLNTTTKYQPTETTHQTHYYPTTDISARNFWWNRPVNRVNIYPYTPEWWQLDRDPLSTTTTTTTEIPISSTTTTTTTTTEIPLTTTINPSEQVTLQGSDLIDNMINGNDPSAWFTQDQKDGVPAVKDLLHMFQLHRGDPIKIPYKILQEEIDSLTTTITTSTIPTTGEQATTTTTTTTTTDKP